MRDYFELTKPRMVLANLLAATAAYLFGTGGAIVWSTLMLLVVGLGLVIGGSCALNNVYDVGIDAKMSRTKKRALPAGRLNANEGMVFGAALIAVGLALILHINALSFLASLVGFVVYVFAYTPLKHHHATALFVGAVAGATPPVIGYAAAVDKYDWYALGFFIFLFVWQVPHFLAIARYRYKEYAAAGVPLLVPRPTERARKVSRAIFFGSLVLLLGACVALVVIGYSA